MKLFTTALLLLWTLGAIKAQINYEVRFNELTTIKKGEAWPDLKDTLSICYFCCVDSHSASVGDSLWADFCHHLSRYKCIKELYVRINRNIDLSLLDQSKLKSLEKLYISGMLYDPFQSVGGLNSELDLSGLSNLKVLVMSVPVTPKLPESIGSLAHLECISVDFKLSGLPKSMRKLHHLNQLTVNFDSLYTLPSVIYQLKNLTHLVVEGSKISYLSPKISKLHKLKELELYKTLLPDIPPAISRLKKLRKLNLQDDEKLEHISISTLKKCKALRSLWIIYCPVVKNVKELMYLLEVCKKMEVFCMYHKCYG